jgi:hypothetical protein
MLGNRGVGGVKKFLSSVSDRMNDESHYLCLVYYDN